MLEPTYSSVDVMKILQDEGIRTARERVNRMADALFGRHQSGLHRKITRDQMLLIREAFKLIDQAGLPRPVAIALCTDPDRALADLDDLQTRANTALAESVAALRTGWKHMQAADSDEARLAAAHQVKDAARIIDQARNLIAA